MGAPAPGETVVDVGAGSGMDTFLAARAVGPAGAVVAVDMTAAMLERGRESVALTGMRQIEYRRGLAEALPIEDATADLVISNGVIDLVPDKAAVFREAWRVLKPGGGAPDRRHRRPPGRSRGRPSRRRGLDRLNRGRSPGRRVPRDHRGGRVHGSAGDLARQAVHRRGRPAQG
jgi:SAM-dependent methyltransferase